MLRQVPGPRHVALDRGHLGRRRAPRRVDRQQATREDQASRHHRGQRRPEGPGGAGSPSPAGSGGGGSPSPGGYGGAGSPPVSRGGLGGIVPPEITQRRPRDHGAGQGEQEAEQRRAAHRDPAHVGRDRLAHREPAPGERVRPSVPHRLDGHPPARHRGGPVGQAEQQPLADGEHREDDRQRSGQRGPRVPGLVDQPGQQGHEQREAERQPAPERAPQAPPGQRDDEQGRPEYRQRPGADRGEGGVQRQAARDREEQRPAGAEPA